MNMASQAFIIAGEEKLIAAQDTVDELVPAIKTEAKLDGYGKLYSENRNHWGTLHVNACYLRTKLNALISELEKTGGFKS
jgi:hypothetical protein